MTADKIMNRRNLACTVASELIRRTLLDLDEVLIETGQQVESIHVDTRNANMAVDIVIENRRPDRR